MAPVGPLVPGNFTNLNKSEKLLKAEEIAAQHTRGKIACKKTDRSEKLDDVEHRNSYHYLDPTHRLDEGRKRYR